MQKGAGGRPPGGSPLSRAPGCAGLEGSEEVQGEAGRDEGGRVNLWCQQGDTTRAREHRCYTFCFVCFATRGCAADASTPQAALPPQARLGCQPRRRWGEQGNSTAVGVHKANQVRRFTSLDGDVGGACVGVRCHMCHHLRVGGVGGGGGRGVGGWGGVQVVAGGLGVSS